MFGPYDCKLRYPNRKSLVLNMNRAFFSLPWVFMRPNAHTRWGYSVRSVRLLRENARGTLCGQGTLTLTCMVVRNQTFTRRTCRIFFFGQNKPCVERRASDVEHRSSASNGEYGNFSFLGGSQGGEGASLTLAIGKLSAGTGARVMQNATPTRDPSRSLHFL